MEEQKTEKKPKENVLYIEGMHCSSCEILIEKKLLRHDQVIAADVSLGNESAKVYVERGKFLDLDQLNEEFKEDGYVFSKNPFPPKQKKLYMYDGERLVINKEKLRSVLKSSVIILSFLLFFYLVERMQFGRFVSVDATSSLPAFFLLGLVAGVSSCAALIGGILLSMIKHWNELYLMHDAKQARKVPHLLFHSGRLISFFLLGGVLGMLGDVVSLNNTIVYSSLVLIISAMMILLALQMLGVAWAQKFQFRLPKFITRFAADEHSFSGKQMPFLLGVFTFFLPCGFTLIAQGVALASGGFFTGAMIMLFFALGTLPMLAGISVTGLTFTKRPHLTAKFTQIAGVLVLFFALYNVNGQLNVLGVPSLSDLGRGLMESSQSEEMIVPAGEEQIIQVIAEGFEYRANGPTVFAAGVPTVLRVDNQGVLGCGAFIAARGLFDNFVSLNRGENLIDLGAPKKGSYKLTCSMGMVPPLTLTFK